MKKKVTFLVPKEKQFKLPSFLKKKIATLQQSPLKTQTSEKGKKKHNGKYAD